MTLVKDAYTEEECKDMALALDYVQFWLRFNDGREFVKDVLDLTGNPERHQKLVTILVEGANALIEDQMSACMPHVQHRTLANGAELFLLDVEIHAHKFTFPPPGKTSGEVHDRLCRKNAGKPVVTIGFGPDFAVLRSRGVMMNIPRMVRELREEIPGGGISGGRPPGGREHQVRRRDEGLGARRIDRVRSRSPMPGSPIVYPIPLEGSPGGIISRSPFINGKMGKIAIYI